MPGFSSIGRYADAQISGRTRTADFKKVPSQATTAGWWADLSMAGGFPVPQYYAASPLEAATLNGWRGIYHGDDVAPCSLHITDLMLMTPTAAMVGEYRLCDYLLFYPFIDGDSLDTQTMVNDVTLPRYADGDGVMVMAVAVAPTTGGGSFTFDYVNHNGDARTSPVISCSTVSASIASLITSQQATAAPGAPWLPLTGGCRGVRQVTAVNMQTAAGGLFALVLVKPLLTSAIREINTPREIELIRERAGPPRVYDDAYLGLITNCAGSIAAGTLSGRIEYVWSPS